MVLFGLKILPLLWNGLVLMLDAVGGRLPAAENIAPAQICSQIARNL
jgi:hypothetical protein